MGDENTVLSRAEARHLLRRTGFGALARDVDQILLNGETRGQAVDRLLAMRPPRLRPSGRYLELAHGKWIRTLIKTRAPLQSKLVLFWHDHFATSAANISPVASTTYRNPLPSSKTVPGNPITDAVGPARCSVARSRPQRSRSRRFPALFLVRKSSCKLRLRKNSH